MWFIVKSPTAQSGLLLPVSFQEWRLGLSFFILLCTVLSFCMCWLQSGSPLGGLGRASLGERPCSDILGVFFTLCQDTLVQVNNYRVPIAGSSGCKSHNVDHDSPLVSHSMSIWLICLLLGVSSSLWGGLLTWDPKSFFQCQQLVHGRHTCYDPQWTDKIFSSHMQQTITKRSH